MSNMETLKRQQEEKEDDEINQLAQKKTLISIPNEIVQEILSRLPVKPILQFRSVSKQWLSLISDDPSFPKLHYNRSLVSNERTPFFISAYDTSTNERYFLSAPYDGGPVTHLITLYDTDDALTTAEHLNGLVFFTSRNSPLYKNFAFVVNPATYKVFKVPPPPPLYNHMHCRYFFGFDEPNTEHKILSIIRCSSYNPKTFEFMIFSLSTYSWRHIPVDLEDLPPVSDMINLTQHSVCVNSVIHFMLSVRYQILAFDLTTEKFSIINLPQGVIPCKFATKFTRNDKHILKFNEPFLIKDKELIGVVCHDLMIETNQMHIWILQDYAKRVWVRETVTPHESWIELDGPEIKGYHHMASLMFSCRRLSWDMVNAFILDRKTKSFKLVNFNLGYPFLHSTSVKFHQVRSYVESILPLRRE